MDLALPTQTEFSAAGESRVAMQCTATQCSSTVRIRVCRQEAGHSVQLLPLPRQPPELRNWLNPRGAKPPTGFPLCCHTSTQAC